MAQFSLSTLLSDYGSPAVIVLAVLLVLHLIAKFSIPKLFPAFVAWFTEGYNKDMDSFKHELLQQDLESLIQEGKADGTDAGQPTPTLDILEIGVGTGANFKYYPDGTSVVAIEPNRNFLGYLAKSVAVHSPRVRLQRTVIASAEDLRGHVEDSSVDAVVSTLVLCSVRDVDAVIREAKRVLKPGGRFYFLEHVAAEPGTWLGTIQWLIHLPWWYLFDGCVLTRTPWTSVDQVGFSNVNYKKFTAPISLAFKLIAPHVMGTATK